MAQTAKQPAGGARQSISATPAKQVERPQAMRLDPRGMPHRIGTASPDGPSWTIDRNGVVMKRKLTSGLDVSMALPARAFNGVAARAIEHDDGSYTVSLELLHRDPDLCVPLLVSDDMADIAADWHAWSRMFALPMLIVGADGVARPVREELGAVLVNAPKERRKRHRSVKHRSWFARRRKTGLLGRVEKITGEELIARS